MQQDSQYPASPAPPRTRAGSAIGTLAVWAMIVLACVLIWSGLIAGIVALWRVIL